MGGKIERQRLVNVFNRQIITLAQSFITQSVYLSTIYNDNKFSPLFTPSITHQRSSSSILSLARTQLDVTRNPLNHHVNSLPLSLTCTFTHVEANLPQLIIITISVSRCKVTGYRHFHGSQASPEQTSRCTRSTKRTVLKPGYLHSHCVLTDQRLVGISVTAYLINTQNTNYSTTTTVTGDKCTNHGLVLNARNSPIVWLSQHLFFTALV